MPIYEYECVDHGVFEDQRSIARSDEDGSCPVCENQSPRIVSAPNLGRMERSQVKAMDRNEKSRHEPRVVQAVQAAPQREGQAAPLRAASGGYPWAIGH
jgi:putative FmdB family regulatory protein